MEGLEPTRLAALDPKSSASTNFATSALSLIIEGRKGNIFYNPINHFYNIPKHIIFESNYALNLSKKITL